MELAAYLLSARALPAHLPPLRPNAASPPLARLPPPLRPVAARSDKGVAHPATVQLDDARGDPVPDERRGGL
nr:unnamed protein product [Digitaria exilis]